MSSTVTVGLACEDNGHFFAVTCLVDATLVAHHDWLDGILEDCRSWHGVDEGTPWYKFAPADAYDLRPFIIDGKRIAPQGHIDGQPLKAEAGMWRKVLLMFCHREPRPDVVILARDMDGYPERLAGIVQVRDGIRWPFKVAVAMAAPEVEAWHVAGFVAEGEREEEALEEVQRGLSFDPTMESHRLTSHPNDAPTDAKRVLARLCEEDAARMAACLSNRTLLHERGEKNGLRSFLAEVDEHLVPLFGARR
jgi:hypothetical protein